jgi:hypothetical protein
MAPDQYNTVGCVDCLLLCIFNKKQAEIRCIVENSFLRQWTSITEVMLGHAL